eukprot:5475851-Amphidinium_carterae.1
MVECQLQDKTLTSILCKRNRTRSEPLLHALLQAFLAHALVSPVQEWASVVDAIPSSCTGAAVDDNKAVPVEACCRRKEKHHAGN